MSDSAGAGGSVGARVSDRDSVSDSVGGSDGGRGSGRASAGGHPVLNRTMARERSSGRLQCIM